MEPLRGLLTLPGLLVTGVVGHIGALGTRLLHLETLDERLKRKYGDRYVNKMTPDMAPKVKP